MGSETPFKSRKKGKAPQPGLYTGKNDSSRNVNATTNQDVFSAGNSDTLDMTSGNGKNKANRRPRRPRAASDPLSITSGAGRDDPIVKTKTPNASRRKKKDVKTSASRNKETHSDMVPALNGLQVANGQGSSSQSCQQGERLLKMGLRYPLDEEDDDVESVLEDGTYASDDYGRAQASTTEDEATHGRLSGAINMVKQHQAAPPVNPGASLLAELRMLSQSAPGDRTLASASHSQQAGVSDHEQRSGSGTRSAAKTKDKRTINRTGKNVAEDESSVWEMPDAQERGSGKEMTVS